MSNGQKCYDECADYHKTVFPEGITSGSAWYPLYGGMQDWIYEHTNGFDITLEIGCNQYPPANTLPQYWRYNKRALLNYIKEIHKGIKGTVSDAISHALLPNVTVHVLGRQHNITTSQYGDYFRLLLPGFYEVVFERAGYEPERVFVSVQNTMAQIIHIHLKPAAHGSALESGGKITAPQSELVDDSPSSQHLKAPEDASSTEHSLIVATLVMTVVTVVILILMLGAYIIQKRRLVRSQSVSMEMQPTSMRSAGTGVHLASATSPTSGGHLSAA